MKTVWVWEESPSYCPPSSTVPVTTVTSRYNVLHVYKARASKCCRRCRRCCDNNRRKGYARLLLLLVMVWPIYPYVESVSQSARCMYVYMDTLSLSLSHRVIDSLENIGRSVGRSVILSVSMSVLLLLPGYTSHYVYCTASITRCAGRCVDHIIIKCFRWRKADADNRIQRAPHTHPLDGYNNNNNNNNNNKRNDPFSTAFKHFLYFDAAGL